MLVVGRKMVGKQKSAPVIHVRMLNRVPHRDLLKQFQTSLGHERPAAASVNSVPLLNVLPSLKRGRCERDAGAGKLSCQKPVPKNYNLATYDCDAITFCTKTATSPSWSRGMPLSSQNWIATILGSSPRFQLIWRPGRPANSTGKEKS